jgi:predicted permease
MAWRRFLHRTRWDEERRLEIESHLALEIDENVARGMAPDEARFAAHRKFGNVTLAREQIFRMNTIALLDALWHDLHHAVRLLRLNPGFAAVAVFSLALGIGANTAIFSLVNEFLLRVLPVRNPEELVLFRAVDGVDGRMSRAGENNGSIDHATGRNSTTSFSLLIFERFRAHHGVLSDTFAFAPFSAQPHVLIDGRPEVAVSAQLVSGTYHAGLGVAARVGRTFTSDDDVSTAVPSAVLSYRYWDARFGRDPGVLGKTIVVNRIPTVIIGVTPAGFGGAAQVGESPDISLPLAHYLRFQPDRVLRAEPWYWWIRIMGRLAPGATAEQARASLEPTFQEAAREGWLAGRSRDVTPRAVPAVSTLSADPGAQGENNTRRQYARSLYMLMGLVGLVLVAACANVANLLLARGTARRREIALRLALGAGRTRIIGQLLAESLTIAFAGAALGTALAWWSRGLLLALRPFGTTSVVFDLPLDARVLTFTIAVAVATSLLFGLAPALHATRIDLNSEFQGGTRLTGRRGRSRLSQGLMVVQIALSLVLLVTTGLFMRTLSHLQAAEAGFNRHNLVLFTIDATSAGYAREQFAALHSRLQARLERVPGVRASAFSRVPLLSRVRANNTITVQGSLPPPPDAAAGVNTNGVSSNFFAAMELPIILGRSFRDPDDAAAPSVAVVNQTLVKKYFGQENPIGRRLVYTLGPFGSFSAEIVGIAGDAKYTDLRAPVPPTMYLPASQLPGGTASFALRVGVEDSAAVYPLIRAAVRDIDPTLPALDLRTQDEQIDRLHAQERLFARLSGFFGVLALALACVGLYGLMSYAVLKRTAEIGLRMALGALPSQVMGMMLRESITLVFLGIAAGIGAASGLSRLVATMLFGLSPVDPPTYAAMAALLGVVTVAASAWPALRASRLEPTEALREE